MHILTYTNIGLLKMLGLYFYTLIICHKSYNILSILNQLTLQKKLPPVVTNNVFWRQNKNKTSNTKPLPEPGREPVTFCIQSGCITSVPPSHLRVSVVIKLYNCFDAMGGNVKEQNRICRLHLFL